MTDINEITGAVLVALVERAAEKAVKAIPAPLDGKDGVGIAGAMLVDQNLVLTYSNGAAQDLGRVCGRDGKDGGKGRDGVGIASVDLTADARLVVRFTDGTATTLGQIKARDGKPGVGVEKAEVTEAGRLVITLTDGRRQDAGQVKAEPVAARPGRDGVGIASAEIDDAGHLILVLTDGRRLDLGRVRGRDGGVVLERGGGGGGSGAGGAAAWGAVTGTLSDQTDLQAALDAKAATAHTHAQADVTNLVADLAAKRPANVIFCRLAANYTLTSQTAAQRIFNTTASGAVTLPTGLYRFRCFLHVLSMSATSGNAAFNLLGAGTATLARIDFQAVGVDAASPLAAATRTGSMSQASTGAASMVTAAVNTGMAAVIEGTFDVTAAGTLIPSIALVTAAAAVVQAGSNILFERIGATGVDATGEWS